MLIKTPFNTTALYYQTINKTKSIKNIHQQRYICCIPKIVCSIKEQAVKALI